jgi:hypothetical protein
MADGPGEPPLDPPLDPKLEAALDELADVRPDAFVATRDRLAKELRAEGHAEAAAAVRARRRPNVVAWSVNQVARGRPELVAALFVAADDLRAAVLEGDGDALRAAMRAQRTRAGELTDAALERAAETSPNAAGHRDAISGTWEAAAADPALRTLVTAGRLTTELRPGASLADGGGEVQEPGDRGRPGRRTRLPRATEHPTPRPAARASTLPRDELALRRAEEALAEARAELVDAEAAVKAADDDLAQATRASKRAADARTRAERRVQRAERAVEERRSR